MVSLAYSPTSNEGVFLFLHIPIAAVTCVLILAILTGIRWDLSIIFICISLMTKDIEHFFKCFPAIWDSSVENFLFRSVLYFLIGLFGSLESTFLSYLYILHINPLWDIGLVNIFSQSMGCRLCSWQCPLLYRSFPILWGPFVKGCSYSISHWCSVQEVFPCAQVFESLPQFLFY